MAGFIQLLIGGVSIGIIYGVVAIGFVLLWQTSQTINFAQGEFVMVPMFLMVLFHILLKIPLWPSILLTMAVSGLMGYLFEKLMIKKLLPGGVLVIVIATLGLSGLLRYGMQIAWTPQTLFFPHLFSTESTRVAGVVFSPEDIWNIVLISVIILALHFWIKKTKLGKAMQAVAQNREMATLMGINVSQIIMVVFFLNSILAGVAAVFAAPIFFVRYDIGVYFGLKAFIAAVIGGFNQIQGALVGGLAVGLIETFAAAYISTAYRDAFTMVVLLIILLVKPEGIVGIKEEAA
ncbi:MAG: branched-chain amino acid ABC transporter permease [Candidatus Tectomicrobia bacterium]|uniref:Branched-chain amino acid ABC transporter permease n=1 Tax=Tectimicrobiota bacterium TaxID=2528274 RepID=A0A933GMA1_UNCTE|nr:branched-chain amino acid ABC transporter permease [Candidatus Tectomicrobia bacterium]